MTLTEFDDEHAPQHYWLPISDPDTSGQRHAFRGRRWHGQDCDVAICGTVAAMATPSEIDWIHAPTCQRCNATLKHEQHCHSLQAMPTTDDAPSGTPDELMTFGFDTALDYLIQRGCFPTAVTELSEIRQRLFGAPKELPERPAEPAVTATPPRRR